MSWIRNEALSWVQFLCLKVIRCGPIPNHIAFIMDGNRRFATKNNTVKAIGHSRGFDKLSETLQWCLELGVTEVTVYAFSIENFKRTKDEVETLMNLAREKFQKLISEEDLLREKGVRIRIIGNMKLLPKDLRKLMARSMILTKNNNKSFLNIAFPYTSRDEITCAIQYIVDASENNILSTECISEDLISKSLYTNESSDPDLLIRTSGELRFSDFLLWQSSFTCIYFTDVLWPEFGFWDLISSIFYYQRSYKSLSSIKSQQRCIFPEDSHQKNTYLTKLQTSRRNELHSYATLS